VGKGQASCCHKGIGRIPVLHSDAQRMVGTWHCKHLKPGRCPARELRVDRSAQGWAVAELISITLHGNRRDTDAEREA
jgi:hypothetical protein